MNVDTLLNQMQDTISVPDLRRLLSLGKTESYRVVKLEHLEVVMICGKMRVTRKSFDEWYDNQTRFSRIDGVPPGAKLKANSYSVQDVAAMLNVSDDTIYQRIYQREFETFQAEHQTRITRQSFEAWYARQNKLRLPENRESDDKLREISYSQPEIARMLGIKRNKVYPIVKRQCFKCITVAGQKRVLKSEFDRWFESQDHYHKAKPKAERKPVKRLESKPLYTARELIDGLGIDHNNLYRLIKCGKIKAVKQRCGYMLPQEEAMKLINGGEQNGIDPTKE